jgi:L-amino acid N-acyltransferase YncA
MTIRIAIAVDLPRIVAIYNQSIPGRQVTADTEVVTVRSRQDWFAAHAPTSRPIWVWEEEETILGWLSLNSFYGRPAYQQTVEFSLYVDYDHHRHGIGRSLMAHMLEHSPKLGIRTILGFVFARNQPSLRLCEVFGFERWGYLPQVAALDDQAVDLIILGRNLT